MNLQVRSETERQYNPIFLKILEEIPGGVTIRTNRVPYKDKFLFPGTPLHADTTSVGLYDIVKTARLKVNIDTANVVTIYVYASNLPNKPGNMFTVGDYIMLSDSGTAVTITAITRGTLTNGVGTDIIVMTAASGGFNAASVVTGTNLQQAYHHAHTGAYALYTAQCVLGNTVRVRLESGTTLVNVSGQGVVRGTLKENILPYGMPAEAVKTPLTARIRFA